MNSDVSQPSRFNHACQDARWIDQICKKTTD